MAYTSLVFRGGGVLLIAYITALQELHKRGLIGIIERVAGASAGAITATLFTILRPDQMYAMMQKFDFSQLEDKENILDLLSSRHGLYRGKWFQNWIESIIAENTGKSFCTFKDLHDAGHIDLSIVTTYLNEGDSVVCNYQSTPDVIVSEAVRASMSIPIIFDLFEFTQGMNPGQQFVDGGLELNYPISLFDGYPEDEVLGFYLHDISNVQAPINLDSFNNYARANFEALMNAQNAIFFSNAKWVRQSLIIDTKGISATDFKITPTQIAILEQSGVEAVNTYFK